MSSSQSQSQGGKNSWCHFIRQDVTAEFNIDSDKRCCTIWFWQLCMSAYQIVNIACQGGCAFIQTGWDVDLRLKCCYQSGFWLNQAYVHETDFTAGNLAANNNQHSTCVKIAMFVSIIVTSKNVHISPSIVSTQLWMSIQWPEWTFPYNYRASAV